MTILHLIGQFFLHWLVLTTPLQAPTTPAQSFFSTQQDALEQMAALPLWKKPGTSYWSLLSEGLEETNAGNEKDGDDAAPASEHHSMLSLFSALHAIKLPTQARAFGNIPLYLRYCSLKIHLV